MSWKVVAVLAAASNLTPAAPASIPRGVPSRRLVVIHANTKPCFMFRIKHVSVLDAPIEECWENTFFGGKIGNGFSGAGTQNEVHGSIYLNPSNAVEGAGRKIAPHEKRAPTRIYNAGGFPKVLRGETNCKYVVFHVGGKIEKDISPLDSRKTTGAFSCRVASLDPQTDGGKSEKSREYRGPRFGREAKKQIFGLLLGALIGAAIGWPYKKKPTNLSSDDSQNNDA